MSDNDKQKQERNEGAMESPVKDIAQEKRMNLINGVPYFDRKLLPIEVMVQRIFRQFRLDTFTFHLFMMNCIMWLAENLYFYFKVHDWECVQLFFFAKHQPTISYNLQLWRIILASFAFRGWLMFFFNNFALNMLGYCIQKQSLFKMVFTFYAGIIGGHLLSSCFLNPSILTTGTSCGTIALLPLQICRFIRLRKQNPLEAKKRIRFLIINITSNFILNIFAVFGMDPVDWISHIGCIISGVLCMFYFQNLKGLVSTDQHILHIKIKRGKFIRIVAILSLFIFFATMWIYILWKLPHSGHGKSELKWIEERCHIYMN